MVFDAGGADSVHVQDLEHFTSTYVNEKFRKIRMKVYAMVAKYPSRFPRIKMACIKWSWKQPTESGGHCTLPPSIGRKLSFTHTCGMARFMVDLEAAMKNLNLLASTVVDDRDLRIKWVAEVDIGLMSKVFSVSKLLAGWNIYQQELELCKQCPEPSLNILQQSW